MFVYNVEAATIYPEEQLDPRLTASLCAHYFFSNSKSRFSLVTHEPKLDSTCVSVHFPISSTQEPPEYVGSSFIESTDFSVIGKLQAMEKSGEQVTLSFSDSEPSTTEQAHWRGVYKIAGITSAVTKEANRNRLLHTVLWQTVVD